MLNVWIIVELIILFFALTVWMALIMIRLRIIEKQLKRHENAIVSNCVLNVTNQLTPEQKESFDRLVSEHLTKEV